MPVPDFQSFFIPVLRLAADGHEHSMAEMRHKIAEDLNLSPEDLSQRLPSGGQTVYANRVAWVQSTFTGQEHLSVHGVGCSASLNGVGSFFRRTSARSTSKHSANSRNSLPSTKGPGTRPP